MRGNSSRFSARLRAVAIARTEQTPVPRLELSSLVDVAFLLLTFFILTSTLEPKEADLRFSLIPVPSIPARTDFEPEFVRIKIDSQGVVWCNEVAMSSADSSSRAVPALLEKMKEVHSVNAMFDRNSPVVVVIESADEVKGQRFMDVMNCLAEAGVDNIRLEGFVD